MKKNEELEFEKWKERKGSLECKREERVVRLKNGMVGIGYVRVSGWGSHTLRLYQIVSTFFLFLTFFSTFIYFY